jgi:hypothetical protein
MRRTPARVLLVCCTAVLLLAAGCGDDGGDPPAPAATAPTTSSAPPSPSAPAKADYIRQADEICAEGDRKTDAIPQPRDDSSGPQIATYLRQLVEATEPQVDEVVALPRPAGDEQLLSAIYDDERDLLGRVRELIGVFDAGNVTQGLARFQQLERDGDDINRRLRDYGFQECGQDEDSGPSASPSASPSGASRADYIAEADRICAAAATRARAVAQPANQQDGAAVAAYLREVVGIARDAYDRIRDLEPPAVDASRLRALYDGQVDLLDELERAGGLYAAGRVSEGRQALGAVQPRTDAQNAQLRAYGFRQCGRS